MTAETPARKLVWWDSSSVIELDHDGVMCVCHTEFLVYNDGTHETVVTHEPVSEKDAEMYGRFFKKEAGE